MTKIAITFSILLALAFGGAAPAQARECKTAGEKNCTVTLRDSRGVKTGTENRGNDGKVTTRDSRGVKTGTIQTKPRSNCEVIRNSRGVKIGTRGNC